MRKFIISVLSVVLTVATLLALALSSAAAWIGPGI